MDKLQIRVDREDAETIARALRYLGFHWNDTKQRHRALELAEWLDYRIARYFGIANPAAQTDDRSGTRAWFDRMMSGKAPSKP